MVKISLPLTVIVTSIFFGLLTFSLFSTNVNPIYSQNITNTTTTNKLAEDLKDCFLQFDRQDEFGHDSIKLLGLACYETYKGEGKFPHQMSKEESSNLTKTITELTKASDLERILKVLGWDLQG